VQITVNAYANTYVAHTIGMVTFTLDITLLEMTKLYISLIATLSISSASLAQNLGVDVATPLQKLDVAGGIRIGTSPSAIVGSIRFNAGQFEVCVTNGVWIPLASMGPTGPTGAQGNTGPTGSQGIQGIAGPTGSRELMVLQGLKALRDQLKELTGPTGIQDKE
jgi:hypothetical protein